MADLKECWGYSDVENAERWSGMCSTREEAIAEGFAELGGSEIWIHSGYRPDPMQFFPDADDILTTAGERASDEAGEAAEDYPDFSKEAEADLDAMLDATFKAWVAKHKIRCNFWIGHGEPERVERPAGLASGGRDGE